MGLIDQIIGVESGGNPNATNPRSSASGLGQFIDSTWLDMLAKHRPDITGTPEQLLALKSDPQLSKAMTEAYASDNGAILSKAGHEATPGNTYLAHFAGPKGAVSVLNADPSAPVGQILGAGVVKANPFLANMTAGDLRAWADKKMGGTAGRPAPPLSPPMNVAAAPPIGALPSQAAPISPMQIGAAGGVPAPAQSQSGAPLDLASFQKAANSAPANMPAFSWSPGQQTPYTHQLDGPSAQAPMLQAPPIQYFRPQMQAYAPLRRGFVSRG